ncbi:MAG: hypothetical protein DCC75_13620 [Proteobacteria bacterium]|nr:MAG: hypothetical protein DCC75_13620 [Pseudomonadota bacterium]
MKFKKRRSKHPKHSSPKHHRLEEKLEVVSNHQEHDRLDDDLQAYIQSFLNDFQKELTLDPINLMTKESAVQAIGAIDRAIQKLDHQRKLVGILKDLVVKESLNAPSQE